MIKQNDEFKTLLLEQNKTIVETHSQLFEMCKNGIIQNNTINKMIENGFIVREGRGDYRVVDTVFGYYMAEITTREQFKVIYEDKVISSMLGITKN